MTHLTLTRPDAEAARRWLADLHAVLPRDADDSHPAAVEIREWFELAGLDPLQFGVLELPRSRLALDVAVKFLTQGSG